ncbi:hypothetical protein NP233_g2627 [Leucocoprinus birnbaumii]|uniref:DUF6697 domain-containing protein n=1 Tax=Leucocoprinus birnbaumii TaxID=56174 RepID=A0AAD5VY23_9AGAR|nr:hypothetical protein NP233_g2627 [Leucocoprinus birnbaumii]
MKEEEHSRDILSSEGTATKALSDIIPKSQFAAFQNRRTLEAYVELPTWEEVQERKLREEMVKIDLVLKIKNERVKIKAGLSLKHETLADRITKMNCPMFDIQLDQGIRDIAVPREFLSSIYGGNPQVTFPSIGKQFSARHKYDDFMYPSLDYNPEAAQVPGAPGLFFAVGDDAIGHEWNTVQRVITRIASGQWQYMGQYSMTPTESLTLRELAAQPEKFLTTWGRETCAKTWGQDVVRRVAARKRFKCQKPTEAQIQAVEDSGEYKRVTPEDIKAALLTGEEVMGVWEMRCVGYEEDFQREIVQRFEGWTPPPRKPRKKKAPEPNNALFSMVDEIEIKKEEVETRRLDVSFESETEKVPSDSDENPVQAIQSPVEFLRVYVEVPTWEEVRRRKHILMDDKKVKNEILDKIRNPRIKVKIQSEVDEDTLAERIKKMDSPFYDIKIPQADRDVEAPRALFSSLFGGNSRQTFPKIAKKFLDQHGLDDFMFPKLNWNPHVPQVPGAPGLLFLAGGHAKDMKMDINGHVLRVITCLEDGHWLYMGQYSFTPTESLTLREVAKQDSKVGVSSLRCFVVRKGWGRLIALRIAARKRFKCRNPTEAQLGRIDPAKLASIIAPDDVEAAFKSGEEIFGVWEMRCVGYDVEFQEKIVQGMKTWVPPPSQKPKREKKEAIIALRTSKGQKRKRSDESDEDSDEDTV